MAQVQAENNQAILQIKEEQMEDDLRERQVEAQEATADAASRQADALDFQNELMLMRQDQPLDVYVHVSPY
jgi:hypothetical protein